MSPGTGDPVALARTKAVAIAEPLTDVAPMIRPWAPRTGARTLPMAVAVANEAPLRRCTFRRLSVTPAIGRSTVTGYAVECLYDGLDQPIAMGDLDRARGICQGCTNTGIFRADED